MVKVIIEKEKKEASPVKKASSMSRKKSKLLGSLSKRLKGKKIGRKSKVTLTLRSDPVSSTFDEGSHFFKSELEEAEKALFFR